MANTRQQKDLTKIKFLLNNGKFDGDSRTKVILIYVAFVCLCVGLIVLSITMLSIEQVKEPRMIGEFIGIIIGIIFAFSLLPIIWLILVIRNERLRFKIFIWLEDAIELTAYAKCIGTKYWIGIPLIKLQIEFNINGIKYVRTSEEEKRGLIDKGRPIGYFSGISEFANKEIRILYSQKYDQVMILKD